MWIGGNIENIKQDEERIYAKLLNYCKNINTVAMYGFRSFLFVAMKMRKEERK